MKSNALENGFSIKQKKIKDIAKLALKINWKKTMGKKLINTEMQIMIVKLMVVQRI